jgi:hypothetical protein
MLHDDRWSMCRDLQQMCEEQCSKNEQIQFVIWRDQWYIMIVAQVVQPLSLYQNSTFKIEAAFF